MAAPSITMSDGQAQQQQQQQRGEQPWSLALLLPVTSRGRGPAPVLEGVRQLAATLIPPRVEDSRGPQGGAWPPGGSGSPACRVTVLTGVDEDDVLAREEWRARLVAAFPGRIAATAAVHVFSLEELVPRRAAAGGAPLCWLWERLFQRAVRDFDPTYVLLLGDDVRVGPPGWVQLLRDATLGNPRPMCIVLIDAADPGFPSFPAMAASHLSIFGGRLLPPGFANQDADPFLYQLYRRAGAAAVCSSVTVENTIGGVEAPQSGAYVQPRYDRRRIPQEEWRRLLDAWTKTARAALGARVTTVDVLLPTFRADPAALRALLRCALQPVPGADVSAIVVVDDPGAIASIKALRALQADMPGQLRVRANCANLGAAGTRNVLLDESSAELAVLLDDDVIPHPGCVAAYVAAFCSSPGAMGFAGPTYLPRAPTRLARAVHLSDMSFFWDAPSWLGRVTGGTVPWAVTANMAVRPTGARFSDGFPRTGGGEDVDFCLRLGGRLLAVPGAAATHPWWPGGSPVMYRHISGWAWGDGRLVDLHPKHAYRAAPSAAEFVLGLSVLAALGVVFPRTALLQAAAVALADCCADVARNCLPPCRRVQQPCGGAGLRLLAALEAWAIKVCSEASRLVGHLSRGRVGNVGRRFDWFCGTLPGVAAREKRKAWALFALFCYVAVLVGYAS